MAALPAHLDLQAFIARIQRAERSDPRRAALAGKNLVDGAMRIRRGGGIYGDAPARPATRPAEAIGAWLDELSREAEGDNFHRHAEMREAVAAAAEEVDAAAKAAPGAERLRSALYDDALTALAARGDRSRNFWPWLIAAALGGALVGVLITYKRR